MSNFDRIVIAVSFGVLLSALWKESVWAGLLIGVLCAVSWLASIWILSSGARHE